VGKTHGKQCQSPGKAPWGAWKEFQGRLPTEEELRRKWRDNPLLNVGVALGPVSGLVGVDEDGPAGEESLAVLSGGDLPITLMFSSGREDGGRRRLYAIPPGAQLRVTHPQGEQIAGGVSLLGEGSQTVMPPSRHKSGRRYAWVPGLGPGEIDAALAPAWLVARMTRAKAHDANGCAGHGRLNGLAAPVGERIGERKRNVTLTSLGGSMRRRGMDFEEVLAALLAVNERRCDPPLGAAEVEEIARSVCRYEAADSAFAGGAAPQLDLALVEVIRQDFSDRYQPAFKDGTAAWSQTLERFVKPGEAAYAPDVRLLEKMAVTAGAPRDKKGEVDVDRLIRLFWTLAPVAWREMLGPLGDEAGQSDGCSASAEERFRRQVARCLFAQATFTNKNPKTGQAEPERYTLLQWCRLWAKPGAWAPVRAALLWCRLDKGRRLRIALRSELFGQYGPPELADMPHKQFAKLAELYTVGLGGDSARPGGKRAVDLNPDFIAELQEGPGPHAD
jgi:hypothetical protein